MIASLALWTWNYQNVLPTGIMTVLPTLEGVVIYQGHKGNSCRKASYLAA
jgi:hypothetical protein